MKIQFSYILLLLSLISCSKDKVEPEEPKKQLLGVGEYRIVVECFDCQINVADYVSPNSYNVKESLEIPYLTKPESLNFSLFSTKTPIPGDVFTGAKVTFIGPGINNEIVMYNGQIMMVNDVYGMPVSFKF